MQLYQLKFPNGKSYIGITSKTLKRRFAEHCNPAQSKKLCQKAIHKYGKQNVVISSLGECDNWELLCLAEMEAIEKFNTFMPNGYNMTLGGEGTQIIGVYGDDRKDRDRKILCNYRKNYYVSNKNSINKKHKLYAEKNREYLSKKAKEYRENNKDAIKKRELLNRCYTLIKKKEYRCKNKAKIAEYDKHYRIKNKDALAKKAAERNALKKDSIHDYNKSYYAENKEYYAEYSKNYYKTNREAINARRRARTAQKKCTESST